MGDRRFRHADREAEALRLWAGGETPSAIAAALAVSRGWVYRRLKRAEVFHPARQALPDDDVVLARVNALQGRGYRLVEIERITGWSRASIYRARRRVNAARAWERTTAEERGEIVRHWLAARRVRPVARHAGRAWKTVRDVLVQAGVYTPAGRGHEVAEEHPWRREGRFAIRNRMGPKGPRSNQR